MINLKARAHSTEITNTLIKDGNEIDDDLNRTLKRPNFFQAQKEFIRQCVLFHEIFGNEYIYTLYPVGLPGSVTCIVHHSAQPDFESVYLEKTPFFYFDFEPENIKYILKYDSTEKEIPSDEIIHLNDNRVNIDSPTAKNLLSGESKYQPLRPVINNIKMAYESRGVILKHRGALGILSNAGKDGTGSPLPIDESERIRLQSEYMKYGGLQEQYQIIISDSNLKWQQMGVNPDRLGIV